MEFKGTEIRKYTSERISKSIWIFNPNNKEADETEKLISFAPEMLEMLIISIKEINDLKSHYKDTGHCSRYLYLCEQLIKKATTI